MNEAQVDGPSPEQLGLRNIRNERCSVDRPAVRAAASAPIRHRFCRCCGRARFWEAC